MAHDAEVVQVVSERLALPFGTLTELFQKGTEMKTPCNSYSDRVGRGMTTVGQVLQYPTDRLVSCGRELEIDIRECLPVSVSGLAGPCKSGFTGNLHP